MAGKRKDCSYLLGKRIGRLTVIEVNLFLRVSSNRTISACKVRCDCGTEKIVSVNSITTASRPVLSCGCLGKERRKGVNSPLKKYVRYDLTGEYGIGYCTNTQREFYFDLEDYEKIKDLTIIECGVKGGYRRPYCSLPTGKQVPLHQVIKGKWQDHINQNPFDNRKINLRDCDNKHNIYNSGLAKNNTSGVTGVRFHTPTGKWQAFINLDRSFKSLGLYVDINNAIIARLEAEKKYFKEFAPQQYLYNVYGIKEN